MPSLDTRMLRTMLFTYRCLVGPALFRKYEHGLVPRAIRYPAGRLESWSTHVLNVIFMLLPPTLTLMPIYIYTSYVINGHFDSQDWLTRYLVTFVPATTVCMYVLRTIGRMRTPLYKEFLTIYHSNTYVTNFSRYLQSIRKYDFDFSRWPITYSVEPKLSLWQKTELIQHNPFTSDVNKNLGIVNKTWTQMVAFALAHSFTIQVIFPGTSSSALYVIKEELQEGRDDYIIQYNGVRTKISTADGNTLDVMYVNQERHSQKGHILVICCEGNYSYYETGTMTIPVKAGYSALGWNQPGFANSTGIPFPRKLHNSITAIMKYATEVLGHSLDNIVMYGWSLGGYVATWAAIRYPGVKGVILDAPFDDLFLILRKNAEPKHTHTIREVVRCYMDLNIGNLLMDYNGPLVIVRHTLDTVNCLETGRMDTNRCNSLVVRVITKRHVELSAIQYISILIRCAAWEEHKRVLIQEVQEIPEIKKCMYLVSMYMKDFKASHSVPLPGELFDEVMNGILEQAKNNEKKAARGFSG